MSLPLPVADLLDRFSIGPLTLTRMGPKVYDPDLGIYTDGPVTTITLDPVAAHTADGRDLLHLPEADRNSEVVQFYVRVRPYVADGGQQADVIAYRGRDYRVIRVWDYDLQGEVWICWAGLQEVQQP